MEQQLQQELKNKIQKILDILKQDLATIRTGRATPSLVENIVIDAYGGSARLKVMELATIHASDAQTLVITPFDQATREEIKKGIMEQGTGLNPIDDGQVLRINLPPLSQERREELIKLMKHKLENGRIMIRQARHEAMEEIKTLEHVSEDDIQRMEKEVQKIIDEAMEVIDNMGKHKEQELMQV